MSATSGSEPFLTSPAVRWTAHDLELAALGAAASLRRAGVRTGARVVIDVRDPLLQFAVMLSTAHLGATAVSFDVEVPSGRAAHSSEVVVRDADRCTGVELDPMGLLSTPETSGSLDLEAWVDLTEAMAHVSAPHAVRRLPTSGARLFRRVADIERRLVLPTSSAGVVAAVDPATPGGFAVMLILTNRRHSVLLPGADGEWPASVTESSPPQMVVGTTERLGRVRDGLDRWCAGAVIHDVDAAEGPQPGGAADGPTPGTAGSWAEVTRLLRIVRDDPTTYRRAIDRVAELSGVASALASGRTA